MFETIIRNSVEYAMNEYFENTNDAVMYEVLALDFIPDQEGAFLDWTASVYVLTADGCVPYTVVGFISNHSGAVNVCYSYEKLAA